MNNQEEFACLSFKDGQMDLLRITNIGKHHVLIEEDGFNIIKML